MHKNINILHVTTIDEGGAYKAVLRMQESMERCGIHSNLLLRTKKSNLSMKNQILFLNSPIKKIISKVNNGLNLLLKRDSISRDVFGNNIVNHHAVQDADIIVLHWINSFLSGKSLQQIFQLGKPVIFVLHDMWLFTGGCHVAGECNRYQLECSTCPQIPGNRVHDNSWKNYRDKENLLSKYQFFVLAPSRWMRDCAEKSQVLKGKEITYIPNCYDRNIFYPRTDREALRKKYGIPQGKKVILFGAAFNGAGNPDKGFSYLKQALMLLSENDYFLVIFGHAQNKDVESLKQSYKLAGYIEAESELAELYSLADVYVTPSLQESFGFTVCEAMACGTPVTAFAVGGILDQITHMEDGYLARVKDSHDLAEGIEYCAKNRNEWGKKAEENAKRFSYEEVGRQYVDFFEELGS